MAGIGTNNRPPEFSGAYGRMFEKLSKRRVVYLATSLN
jgi:hypothetical protein